MRAPSSARMARSLYVLLVIILTVHVSGAAPPFPADDKTLNNDAGHEGNPAKKNNKFNNDERVGLGNIENHKPVPAHPDDTGAVKALSHRNDDDIGAVKAPSHRNDAADHRMGTGGAGHRNDAVEHKVGTGGADKPPLKPVRAHMKTGAKIAKAAECAQDVKRFCPDVTNNFQVLDCLQDGEQTDQKVSNECHNYLWQYKVNLTLDIRFDQASFEACSLELDKIAECSRLEKGKGVIIPCLIEHFEEISSRSCSKFINKMASIVFSDYRFMSVFMEDCHEDVSRLQCGRLDDLQDEGTVHSQGQTVKCLTDHRKEIKSKQCKKALLYVAELQADDYHLDRPLFYACRDDRFNLCPELASGDGAIFKCLYRHLGDKRLSDQCRVRLEEREKLIAEDVKVDKVFYQACAQDIKKNHCGARSGVEEDLSRSTVLLCLEKAQSDGIKVKPKCLQEMFELRSELMQDYKISPELVSACEQEIKNHCGGGLEFNGVTIQCLMKEVVDGSIKEQSSFGAACRAQIEELLAVVNPGEDIRLDGPLQRACGGVVQSACSEIKPGDGDVITCLLENLDHEDMTDECEDSLLEIQYFAVRDFRLDVHLYKQCHNDAKNLCGSDGFNDPNTMAPEQGPRIFSCLHRLIMSDSKKDQKPSSACTHEVKRVMRERSMRVKLMPEVEAACMKDIADKCSDEEEYKEIGGELECLQENLEDLQPGCKAQVTNFTIEEMADVEMDRILMKACTPMIKQFCADLLHNEAEPDEVLECLIENKNNKEMDSKCAAGIEHHQIISLKDFRFNQKFKTKCHTPANKYCKNKKTKFEVIACLSEHIRNDTLKEKRQRIPESCRKQLRFELLQRGESLKLDPELALACKEDVHKLCQSEHDNGGKVPECLRKHKKKLSPKCHKIMFKRERDDAIFGDYTVLHVCKSMIKKYCDVNDDEASMLDCLNENKDLVDFSEPCRKVVQRREVEMSYDVRLNPHLQKACNVDITTFCGDVYDVKDKEEHELEGAVIDCLKKQYISKRKPLSKDCEHEVKSHIKEAALDINKNPVVVKHCADDINTHCSEEFHGVLKMAVKTIASAGDDSEEDDVSDDIMYKTFGHGKVIECLKKNYRKLRNVVCKKEIAFMISESRIDIQVDPVLHNTCQKDIISLCSNYPQGQGRQMSCLLSNLEVNPDSLTENCRGMLKRRKELWEYAAEVAPVESLSEMYDQMSASPARNYFFAVFCTAIGLIFIFGLTCGRVTKRIRAEVKNK